VKKLRIGLIGCGAIAPIHLIAIKKLDMDLVVICDVIKERAEKMSKQYGCDYCMDYKELLNRDDIDIVHILTPHYTHYQIARDVLLGGKHCLIEKPMVISRDEAKSLIELIKQNPHLKCGIVFQNRFNETSQVIKSTIDSKQYGDLLGIKASVTWLRDQEYYKQDAWRGKWQLEGGGVLINQAIHTLDLIQLFNTQEIIIESGVYSEFLHQLLQNDISQFTKGHTKVSFSSIELNSAALGGAIVCIINFLQIKHYIKQNGY